MSATSIKNGVVLIAALLTLLGVSAIWLSVNLFVSQVYTGVWETVKKTGEYYKDRIEAQNVFTVAIDTVVDNPNMSFSSITDDLEELLSEWEEYLTKRYPMESQVWIDLVSRLEGGKNLRDIAKFSQNLSQLISTGAIDEESRVKAAVYKASLSGGYEIYLILVKVNGTFNWALISKKVSQPLNQYMFFTGRQRTSSGRPIYFVTGDVIRGPLYVRDKLFISGSPVFKGDVVIVTDEEPAIEGEGNPVFENGYTIKSPQEDEFELSEDFANDMMEKYHSMSKSIDSITSGDKTGVYVDVNADVYVTSQKISSYRYKITLAWKIRTWRNTKNYKYEIEYSSIPSGGYMTATLKKYVNGNLKKTVGFLFNGLIFFGSSSRVYISQKSAPSFFGGPITIASEGDIYISGNVVYGYLKRGSDFERDPSKYIDLSKSYPYDLLNIVSKTNVVMKSTVPKNLYITASVFSLTGEFTLENYRWVKKDTLYIFGSLIQYRRGPVGTFTTRYQRVRCCQTGSWWSRDCSCCQEGEVCCQSIWECWRTGLTPGCCYERVVEPFSGFVKDYTYDPRLLNPLIRPVGTPSKEGEDVEVALADIR